MVRLSSFSFAGSRTALGRGAPAMIDWAEGTPAYPATGGAGRRGPLGSARSISELEAAAAAGDVPAVAL